MKTYHTSTSRLLEDTSHSPVCSSSANTRRHPHKLVNHSSISLIHFRISHVPLKHTQAHAPRRNHSLPGGIKTRLKYEAEDVGWGGLSPMGVWADRVNGWVNGRRDETDGLGWSTGSKCNDPFHSHCILKCVFTVYVWAAIRICLPPCVA